MRIDLNVLSFNGINPHVIRRLRPHICAFVFLALVGGVVGACCLAVAGTKSVRTTGILDGSESARTSAVPQQLTERRGGGSISLELGQQLNVASPSAGWSTIAPKLASQSVDWSGITPLPALRRLPDVAGSRVARFQAIRPGRTVISAARGATHWQYTVDVR